METDVQEDINMVHEEDQPPLVLLMDDETPFDLAKSREYIRELLNSWQEKD
jgi:hypothetical protein